MVPLARYPQLARKEEMSLSDVTVEALETSVYDAKVNIYGAPYTHHTLYVLMSASDPFRNKT